MISGKNLLHRLLFCLRVHFLHNLRIVLNDSRQLLLGQNILPKIVCHDAIRVRRVACTVIVALVKWQEPAVLAAQLGAEFDPCIVQRKMNHASFEGEQSISRVSVGFVLLHRIIGVLLCELVFQFKSDYRQPIDKNTQVQSQLARILGITELTGHAENVLFKQLPGLDIVFSRCQIKHDEIDRIHLDAIAQNIDDASLGEFALEPVQKLAFLLRGFEHAQFVHLFRLRIL